MELVIVGLGKMGGNMARRLARKGHRVVVYDRTVEKAKDLQKEEKNVYAIGGLGEISAEISPPRICWVMVPSGTATEEIIEELSKILSAGDIIIDGGNSCYRDTVRRGAMLSQAELKYIDVGTSGGLWGLSEGYSMTVGGESKDIERIKSILDTLSPAPGKGWGHVGPLGAGHFVKMVHNGIEYGLMQSYAEGFEIMKTKDEFSLNLHQIAEIWRKGSVVRSWLLDIISSALSKDQELKDVEGFVEDSGEGRWAVAEAINENVPTPVIALALMMRLVSRQDDSYAAKLLASMRQQFGGHGIRLTEDVLKK